MFTLRILVGGETRIDHSGLTIERLQRLLPIIESAIPALQMRGPVAVLVKNEEFKITHILGSWR